MNMNRDEVKKEFAVIQRGINNIAHCVIGRMIA